MQDAQHNLEGGAWDLMFDLGVATLARAAWSERQLFEVMVDFWSNHLNVTNPSSDVWYCRHDWDRTVIRAHALGRFEDMLVASTQHPAMLLYLNNAESNKDLPNENYGRELLELHTVSVDAGYSEDEMRNSVLVLTGFGLDWDTGEFHYNKDDHYVGPVQILGFSAKNGSAAKGYTVVLDYLRYLANHPMTATHIARKLCLRFVSDTPPDSLVVRARADLPGQGNGDRSGAEAAVPFGGVRRVGGAEGAPADGGRGGDRADARDPAGRERARRHGGPVLDRRRPRELADGVVAAGRVSRTTRWRGRRPADRSAGGTRTCRSRRTGGRTSWSRRRCRRSLPSPLPNTHGALVQALAKRLIYRTLPAVQRDAVLSLVGKSRHRPAAQEGRGGRRGGCRT